jgi:bifunctional UDP-N-acetylglucosamine pyrophosphorylase/glucosamine-1-phosphate N-acetyltransferase
LIEPFAVTYHRFREEAEMSDGQEAGEGGSIPPSRNEQLAALLARGVIIPDPDRVYVDESVVVEGGTTLLPGTHLRGKTTIGPGCRVGPDSWLEDSVVEEESVVWYSVLEGARVRRGSTVGPFAHLRPGADVGPEAKIGNYVEVKAARIGRGAKVGHLAYVGDAEVGEGVNVGAGAITCNYDGREKHRTVIGDGAFIGTNASLIAPVEIGEDAIIAAGSTITEDVPPGQTAFGRARQVNKARKDEEDA